jgi:hypothetical protein
MIFNLHTAIIYALNRLALLDNRVHDLAGF